MHPGSSADRRSSCQRQAGKVSPVGRTRELLSPQTGGKHIPGRRVTCTKSSRQGETERAHQAFESVRMSGA